jgi:uncharacterized OB-fold protein
MTQNTTPERKAPPVFPGDEPFWKAASEGKLLIKHCDACGENHHYPRPRCPHCGSDKTRWLETSGRATIYSFTPLRKAQQPTAAAIVELPEGPRLLTLIIGADPATLRIDQRVRVVFQPTDGGAPIPMFSPDEPA